MINEFDLDYWLNNLEILCTEFDKKIREITSKTRKSISADLLKRLRDLVEHTAVCCFLKYSSDVPKLEYNCIKKAISFIKGNGKYSCLYNFYEELEVSVSHYSLFGDPAERLMIKYLQELVFLKTLVKGEFGKTVLTALNLFPLDLDKTFQSYYLGIINSMDQIDFKKTSAKEKDTYYVRKKKTIYISNVPYP